jgi:transcriptional regulator with XRE-family HTH domain
VLAKRAGIKQPSLSELETGETKEISGPTLIGLAKALEVNPGWLLNGTGVDVTDPKMAKEIRMLHQIADLLPTLSADSLNRLLGYVQALHTQDSETKKTTERKTKKVTTHET